MNTQVDHLAVPDSLVIEDALPGLNTVAMTPTVMSGQSMLSHTALATTGLCAALVSVPEVDAAAFKLINTVGGASQPIQVTTTEAGLAFRFVSMTGSQVPATVGNAADGRIELPVHGISAGTYILEALDKHGFSKGRTRIIVQ